MAFQFQLFQLFQFSECHHRVLTDYMEYNISYIYIYIYNKMLL